MYLKVFYYLSKESTPTMMRLLCSLQTIQNEDIVHILEEINNNGSLFVDQNDINLIRFVSLVLGTLTFLIRVYITYFHIINLWIIQIFRTKFHYEYRREGDNITLVCPFSLSKPE